MFAIVDAEMSISRSAPRRSRSGASGALASVRGTGAASLMTSPCARPRPGSTGAAATRRGRSHGPGAGRHRPFGIVEGMGAVRAPRRDADVPGFCRALGIPGLADVHVHFMPPRLLRRVWEYFDRAGPLVGVRWPVRYRWSDADRVAHLRALGVRMFSALAYPHRPGMAAA